ncbi:hypothetical protein, conserved [Eimeria acervulina]|uniref:Uncharacterized protein n=1 Tax=Eimeria acervulina TaxID=5801 RepID=U6GSI2_EIMAC|nr:hypothetical protein, conserved [Eimeria acervulina]CDI83216.1 hypothetical protein, conserved [Eimeria acervulina]
MRSLGGVRQQQPQLQQHQPQQQEQQQQQQQHHDAARSFLGRRRGACGLTFGAVCLLLIACVCCWAAPAVLGFPMDATRNAELQQQREQQQQQQQQQEREQAALALLTLHEKYSPPNCKYHPLPFSLNSFSLLSNNGEIILSDVFGLPGACEEEEHHLRFSLPPHVKDGRTVLSVSLDLHRDSFVEFKYIELYRQPKQNALPIPLKHSQADAAKLEERRRTAQQTATILEGAGGAKTRAVLSAPITDPEGAFLYYLTLADEGLSFESPVETPFVLNFAGEEPWKPFTRAVFQTAVRVPPRLHRFVRIYMRVSFRFVSGPFQLLLELFDEETPPDAAATQPACVLGCLGGTPTYNGQLFDHAMPTGYIYKLWLLVGDPMYFDNKNTQCMQFDFEYSLKFESRMTPFEVTTHSWMCPFARLPGLIVQLKKDAEDAIISDELGVIKMHSIDLKDW